MKYIQILLISFLPILLFGQGQRLGINPVSFKLTKNSPEGVAHSFCSDGRARNIPGSTYDRYKWFQNPEKIEIFVNEKPYKEGIQQLMQQGDLLINTQGDENVIFKLNPKSKFKNIKINIKEPNILSDKPGDFNIEPLWRNQLIELKIIPKNVNSFAQAMSFIKQFQKDINIEPSGMMDESTRSNLEHYFVLKNNLINDGIIGNDFESYSEIIKNANDYAILLEKEFTKLNSQPNKTIYKYKDWINDRNYSYFNNNGNVEKWTFDNISYIKLPINNDDLAYADILLKKSIVNKDGTFKTIKDIDIIVNFQNNIGRTIINELLKNGTLVIDDAGILTESSLNKLFELNGVKSLLNDCKINTNEIYYAISSFQKNNELPATGIPDKETINQLFKYKSFIDKINELFENRNNILFSDNLTFENWYYVLNNSKIEKIIYKNLDGTYSRRTIEDKEIENIELRHFNKIKEFNDEIKSFNTFYFSIGSLNFETKRVNYSLNGEIYDIGWVNNPYDELITQITQKLGALPVNSNIIFARDKLQLGIEIFDKHKKEQLTGDQFLNMQYIESRKWVNYTEFISNLKNKLPNYKFGLSSAQHDELEKLKEVITIKTKDDIIAYLAPESFNILADQVSSMRTDLEGANIKVLEINDNYIQDEITQFNVLILSGHKDTNFEQFLKNLANNDLLRNKIVIVFSCYEQGTAKINSYIINFGGAKKVIFFPSQISIIATKAVISEIIEVANNLPKEGLLFEEIVYKAVNNAIKKYPDLESELLLLKNIIPQYSNLLPLTDINNG